MRNTNNMRVPFAESADDGLVFRRAAIIDEDDLVINSERGEHLSQALVEDRDGLVVSVACDDRGQLFHLLGDHAESYVRARQLFPRGSEFQALPKRNARSPVQLRASQTRIAIPIGKVPLAVGHRTENGACRNREDFFRQLGDISHRGLSARRDIKRPAWLRVASHESSPHKGTCAIIDIDKIARYRRIDQRGVLPLQPQSHQSWNQTFTLFPRTVNRIEPEMGAREPFKATIVTQ